MTSQQGGDERAEQERQQELDRLAMLTVLLVLAFCILAYLKDGIIGLFVALVISLITVSGFALYGFFASRRR